MSAELLDVGLSFINLDLEPPREKTHPAVIGNFKAIRRWRESLSRGQRREFGYQIARAVRLTGVSSRHQIPQLFGSEATRTAASERVNIRVARNYGIDPALIETALARYAERSNSIVNRIRDSADPDMAVRFEMVNEVEQAEYPIDLLAIIFSKRYAPKAHQQAYRKLQHMEDAQSVEENPRLREMKDKFRLFTDFMNRAVWMQDRRIGDFYDVFFLSEHDPANKFECTNVRVLEINPTEAETLRQQLPPTQKLTLSSRRRFQVQEGPQKGRIIDVYVSDRLKNTEDQMVKIERKKQADPDTAIRDAIGARFVTNTRQDLDLLIKHLQYCADVNGSDIKIHSISDTLYGEKFNGNNAGSSQDIQMLKFLIRITNVELEMQGFDSISFVNQMYKEGSAHAEYMVNRLFDSGWMEDNFPHKLYYYDPDKLHERMIAKVRTNIQGVPQVTPEPAGTENQQIITGHLVATIEAARRLAGSVQKSGSNLIRRIRNQQ